MRCDKESMTGRNVGAGGQPRKFPRLDQGSTRPRGSSIMNNGSSSPACPSTVLNPLHVLALPRSILHTPGRGYYLPHFTDKEMRFRKAKQLFKVTQLVTATQRCQNPTPPSASSITSQPPGLFGDMFSSNKLFILE